MHSYNSSHGARPDYVLLGAKILAGLVFLGPVFFAVSQTPTPRKPALPGIARTTGGKVIFPAALIPTVPSSLQVVKLTVQPPPETFLRASLAKTGVKADDIQPLAHSALPELKAAPETSVGLVQEDRLIASWDTQTGESQILPQLDKLPAVTYAGAKDEHLTQALTLARQIFASSEILPRDVTQYTLGVPRPVVGSTAQLVSSGGKPTVSDVKLYLTYVAVSRTVSGYKVYGTGSHAAVAIGTDGSLYGLVNRWKAGSFASTLTERRSKAQIQAALLAVLKPLTSNSNVEVISVEVAYVDDNLAAMTPVYRVVSRLHPLPSAGANPQLLQSTDYVATYMAYGNGQLPAELVPGSGPAPSSAPANHSALDQAVVPAGDPTVGRYVVRDAQSGFVSEANGFWDGLQSSHNAGQFTNSQYYWAEPFIYTTDEQSFVNNVNVALTEAHGAPWLFTTESNCCDVVNINDIPATEGYGAANHGKLDYWIIHSCEVVPSAEDNAEWWTPWFKVFQGLHAVMGSRTDMLFDGGAVNQPFGQNIGNGASVVSAWFNATLSYYPASEQPPTDRPSAVTVCGHEPDTVFNTAALPAASCLTNYWQPN
ncbi:DUF6345 domain-containing protein [Granulicella sp. S156]|jgi:phage gp37-like protein|uniref:DUF6345 domain-containing protein n=1 Tax=Granulicella sp. S156 TaxID=1747224 RepID=UPI00131EA702|nr:DUF6345 domain-containing protein [Granulicella sp. S156]